jgi:hypothetical protein
MTESKLSIAPDERIWYDQFTSTDWLHDGIADAYRVKQLRSRKDWWGRLIVLFDGAQGWILSAVVGFLVAVLAYCVDVAETTLFEFKEGYCTQAWYMREKVNQNFAHAPHMRLYANLITTEVLPSWAMYRLAVLVRSTKRPSIWGEVDFVCRLRRCRPHPLCYGLPLDSDDQDRRPVGIPHVNTGRESSRRTFTDPL